MKSRIISSSYLVDFLDVNFDSRAIGKEIKHETDKTLDKIHNSKLNGWEIHFIFRYNTVKQLLIYTRGKSYLKEKYKEVTIHIPIPSIEDVVWGVTKEQEVYDKGHLDSIIDNFEPLDVDFHSYTNLTEYITACMQKAIAFCFINGVSVNGVNVNGVKVKVL